DMDIVDCARLFALTSMAANDALIAVFDAKYTYNLWRPVTAIRNADQTNNSATPRDASWRPLGDTPMHPESVRALHFIGCSFCCYSRRGGQ
ncbi:MAG: hypothetical protein WAN52_05775, partial [Pseudolabrys sp.]